MSDVMLFGVLRMPMPSMGDAIGWVQLKDRAEQAADRIEADAAKIERLRAALTDLLYAELVRPSCQDGMVQMCMCLKCSKERARAALQPETAP